MGRVPTTCITCGTEIVGRNRCMPCDKQREHRRNLLPTRMAYRDPVYRSLPRTGICWICDKPGSDTRDHVVPLAEGGTNTPENIRPAHRACNSARQRYEEYESAQQNVTEFFHHLGENNNGRKR